ncbi:phage portal protein [Citrobacter werkmanii]|uniref:phage portal protein n=1 Tax=Citrobacter werkmanii TaxID=67827 RepID=UPI0037C6CB27
MPESNNFWLAKSALRKLMPGFMPSKKGESSVLPITSMMGQGMIVSRSGIGYQSPDDTSPALSYTGDQLNLNTTLPTDRRARYDILETMAKSPSVNAALSIHISHALSVDKKSRACFNITAIDQADTETVARCKEVMDDIGHMLDVGLPSWAMIMAIYGVAYVRPHAEHGKGITSIESSYYTLPHFVNEFYRGGDLVGFTGDFISEPENGMRTLAAPWELVAMRVPFWLPDHKVRPITWGNKEYSLLTPRAEAPLVETQNYGTSFIEAAYEPWVNLQNALRALLGNRYNSGKMDRLIALATNELDPANAGRYTREVTNGLVRSQQAIASAASRNKTTPTVINHVIPVMSGGKGGVTVDTQTISADINGIEDVMFWLRQMSSSIGVDATMLGWADQMSGGLGEGGWIQTAIQAALRAEWIRKAATELIYKVMDIHLAYKYGKVYTAKDRPYIIEFNSLNTAIQEQENRDRDSRVNYISLVVTILDAIQNNYHLAQSKTMFNYLFGEVLQVGQETINAMLREFEAAKPPAPEQGAGGGGFMESAPSDLFADLDVENMSPEELINLVKFALEK